MATNPPSKLRVMVDANVLISGTGWPRFPFEVLQHAVKGDFQLVLSPFVIDEARDHLSRMGSDLVNQLEALLKASEYEPIPTPTKDDLTSHANLVRDVQDIPVALAAMNAQVDYLISLDKDLTEPGELIHQYLKILLPGTFLREYMGWSSE